MLTSKQINKKITRNKTTKLREKRLATCRKTQKVTLSAIKTAPPPEKKQDLAIEDALDYLAEFEDLLPFLADFKALTKGAKREGAD